jgi:F-type H+-transporting ATPase subunit a
VLSAALFTLGPSLIIFPLPFIALIFFTLFEVLVAFLQAYVFTLLTGVYINAAISHEH